MQSLTRTYEILEAISRTGDGITFDDAEYYAELRCIAVLVHDFACGAIAAVGISAPAWKMTLNDLLRFEVPLRKAAVTLSGMLGLHHQELAKLDRPV